MPPSFECRYDLFDMLAVADQSCVALSNFLQVLSVSAIGCNNASAETRGCSGDQNPVKPSKRAMNCKKRSQCVWGCALVSQVWEWRQGSHAINGYTLRGDYLISVLSLKPEMCWLH